MTIAGVSFAKIFIPGGARFDPYRFAIALGWRQFALFFFAIELAMNVLFAGLYLLQPGSIGDLKPHGFLGAFFFSVETLSTAGCGEMYPSSIYGHAVASLELIVGVGITAIMTGLLFVRFSRPRTRIVYAERAIVTTRRGTPTLMYRFCNVGVETLHTATATLYVLTTTVVAPTSARGRSS